MSLFDDFVARTFRRGRLTIIDHREQSKMFGTPEAGFPEVSAVAGAEWRCS